jgi:hypothetical protein
MLRLCLFSAAVILGSVSPISALDVISANDRHIPQVIFGGEWSTTLLFGNLNDVPVQVPLTFYDGAGGVVIAVPITGVGLVNDHVITVPAHGTARVEIADPAAGAATLGWAYADIPCNSASATCGNVFGQVILRNRNPTRPDFESTYRFTETDRRRVMFLDQRDFFQTVGVIILPKRFPTETAAQTITMRIFNEQGQQILLEQWQMAPGTSRLINYVTEYPQTVGVRGYIEVEGTLINILFTGIRINPSNAFTPMQSYAPQGS